MKTQQIIPRIGVSACLTGAPVRFNGDHKKNDWIVNNLAHHAELVGVCPELLLGLAVPRPALRLTQQNPQARVELVTTNQPSINYTDSAHAVFRQVASQHPNLDGFILKKDSPSCGLERVKVYNAKNFPNKTGIGLFAQALIDQNPSLPKIEEGRLSDDNQKENFLIQVFSYARFKRLPLTMAALQTFQRQNKFLLMEHDPNSYSVLGNIVGNHEKKPLTQVFAEYQSLLMQALRKIPTFKSRTNALEHAMGFLKKSADPSDRQALQQLIQEYRHKQIPFIAVLTMAHHLIKKHQVTYLIDQTFFQAFPRALGNQTRL